MSTTHRVLTEAEERMKKALESTRRELSGIRSGKATPSLLDTVRRSSSGVGVREDNAQTSMTSAVFFLSSSSIWEV